MGQKPQKLRPVYHYTIVRDGKVVGRYTLDEIKEMVKEGKLIKTDQFKHPVTRKWTSLPNLQRAATSLKKKLGNRKGEVCYLDGIGERKVFKHKGMPAGFNIKAKYHACAICHNCHSTTFLIGRRVISCTECDSDIFVPVSKRW